MARARLLIFGAILLTLAAPGHALAPLSGLPLDLPALVLLVLAVAWWIALPGAPPRAGLLAGALVGLAVLKVVVWSLAPAYGLEASYRIDSPGAVSPDSAPGTTRVDRALDFRGDAFPVHFVNDIRYLNFYTPAQPKRDLLPFSARWSGLLVVQRDGEYTLTLESNGPATLELGTGQRVAIEGAGRVRDVTLSTPLPAGTVPIAVTYTRPDEAMPWLVVRDGGQDGPALGGPRLVRAGTPPAPLARYAWLPPLAWAVDGLLTLVLVVALAVHVRTAVSTQPWGAPSPTPPPCEGEGLQARSVSPSPSQGGGGRGEGAFPERALLALYFLLAVGGALVANLHLFGRAVVLSGGNDWLAYESYARDVLVNGPLMTEGRALGQGLPFYYQPGYIYAVALSHLVLGESLSAPLFMNAVLGVLTALGLYALTRQLFGRVAAVVALLLFEVYRQTVFAQTSSLLLSENLLFPLVPPVLLLLARVARTGRLTTLVAAGVALGLAGLARTTPLALLPPALLALLVGWRWLGLGWRANLGRLALLVLVCALTVSLATMRNYLVSGRVVPITSSAGANLWETHRPSSKVDLSRIDRDPLYERLGLDRTTREVLEFARQDPAGYVGTLVPMFLFAVGVQGAPSGSWDVQPLLLVMCLAYLFVSLLWRPARALPTWFLHAFVWSHLAQMTVFLSNQYGFRLILPMYVAMVPIVAGGLAWVGVRAVRLLAPIWTRAQAGAASPTARSITPAARVLVVAVAALMGAAGLGAGEWRSQELAREAFYGLNGDAGIAARQAARDDLLRQADATYFVGDDSRSTDVAYLSGLAYPTLRWFDGARGLVLPRSGEQALYVVPDRAAADFAKRCLGEGASIGRETDPRQGAGLELFLASAGAGECAAPRETIGAPFAEAADPVARLIGLDGPASIEPGRPMDVLIHWETLGRPRNRARPFVRLVDGQGRRWGTAETTVYPSSSWRPGEHAVGLARLDVDPTLPPGQYRLLGGFSTGGSTPGSAASASTSAAGSSGAAAGAGQARLVADGAWGSVGLGQALGPSVRLVSRSTPLTLESLPLDRRLDASLGAAKLIGVDFDRDSLPAGQRLRMGLFWQSAGHRPDSEQLSLIVRRPSGETLQEWRHAPVDDTYPIAQWKPGEIVRDTWDVVMPASLPPGEVELAVGIPGRASQPVDYVALGRVTVQDGDRQLTEPELRARLDADFLSGEHLVGVDYKSRRFKPGDLVDMTLVWQQGGTQVPGDHVLSVALLDEAGRILAQQEGEPAGGKRPTSGWTADEYVEDGWKFRLPRDLPRGRVRLAVSVVEPLSNQRQMTADGRAWVELPIEVGE